MPGRYGAGSPLKRDCRVDELESGFPILKRLEKVGANLDELDYLARRLDSFDKYEAAQFQAMAVRLGTFDMDGLYQSYLLLPAGHGDHGLFGFGRCRPPALHDAGGRLCQ